MVRLIPVTRHGKTVWLEDSPDACPNGHPGGMLPKWLPCPDCERAMRAWQCSVAGCGVLVWDVEHVHSR